MTTSKTTALTVCQAPGCAEGVAWIVSHHVEVQRNGQAVLHAFIHQCCDEHAALNEEAMKSIFTVKPAAVVWRDTE